MPVAGARATQELMEKTNQILSTISRMTSAFNQGDIDGVMQTYEKGAVVVGEPGMPVQGDDALRAMFAGFVAAKANFTFGEHEVVVAGDVALHLTPWQMTGVAPEGAPIEASGLSVAVLRQQKDGAWLMIIDHPFGDAVARGQGGSLREEDAST